MNFPIEFHARKIQEDRAARDAAINEGDMVTAGILEDSIKFRKGLAAQKGYVIV